MAEIITFPKNEDAVRRDLVRMIQENLKLPDGDLKDCIKDRLSSYLAKAPKTPSLSFRMPDSLTEVQKDEIISSLSQEYDAQVSAYAFKFLTDIALLQLELCQCEHGK